MKLPRWLVIGMLTSSVLAVLAAAGWWWVTWPERTARTYLELLAANKLAQARRLVAPGVPSPNVSIDSIVLPGKLEKASWEDLRLEPEERTLRDVLYSRRHFRMPELDFYFTVERGELVREAFSGRVLIYQATDQAPWSFEVSDGASIKDWKPSR